MRVKLHLLIFGDPSWTKIGPGGIETYYDTPLSKVMQDAQQLRRQGEHALVVELDLGELRDLAREAEEKGLTRATTAPTGHRFCIACRETQAEKDFRDRHTLICDYCRLQGGMD